jgi:hypothetical protein
MFQDLGSDNVQALLSGEIDGMRIPYIYSVGPLISSPESHHDDGRGSLQWVDKQPADFVLFVSFGSVNFVSVDQIVELALGLEGNGQRFMWVHPSPPNNASNLEAICTAAPGFRTTNKGS